MAVDYVICYKQSDKSYYWCRISDTWFTKITEATLYPSVEDIRYEMAINRAPKIGSEIVALTPEQSHIMKLGRNTFYE